MEAREEHVDLRATEGTVSTGLGTSCQEGLRRGISAVTSQVNQCSFVGASVLAVVIGEVTTWPAKAREQFPKCLC